MMSMPLAPSGAAGVVWTSLFLMKGLLRAPRGWSTRREGPRRQFETGATSTRASEFAKHVPGQVPVLVDLRDLVRGVVRVGLTPVRRKNVMRRPYTRRERKAAGPTRAASRGSPRA